MSQKKAGKSPQKDTPKVDWKALDMVHPHAAGIDIGGSEHWVAIAPERDERPVRSCQCFTADLEQMADWLVDRGVRSVAMQSSGVYWIPVFEILQQHGLEVYLVNARHTKNLPGRKSDIAECQWLAETAHFRTAEQQLPAQRRNPHGTHSVAASRWVGGASQQRNSAYAEGFDGNEYPTGQCIE